MRSFRRLGEPKASANSMVQRAEMEKLQAFANLYEMEWHPSTSRQLIQMFGWGVEKLTQRGDRILLTHTAESCWVSGEKKMCLRGQTYPQIVLVALIIFHLWSKVCQDSMCQNKAQLQKSIIYRHCSLLFFSSFADAELQVIINFTWAESVTCFVAAESKQTKGNNQSLFSVCSEPEDTAAIVRWDHALSKWGAKILLFRTNVFQKLS